MRVKLIHDERDLVFSRDADVFTEIIALEGLAGRVGRVGEHDSAEAPAHGLELKLVGRHESVIDVAMQEHGRGYALEQAKGLLVGSVVRIEVSDCGVTHDGHDSRNASSPPWNNAYVSSGILALFALSIKMVVIIRNSFSQFRDSRRGCIFYFMVWDMHFILSRWGSEDGTCLWCTLAHICPSRVFRIVESVFLGSGCGKDDSGLLSGLEHWECISRRGFVFLLGHLFYTPGVILVILPVHLPGLAACFLVSELILVVVDGTLVVAGHVLFL
mmetsp:Transcript_14359/g.27266  ORF Transcript_14359/g.27266 Transcript_14359/m.27266 type:complete len:272 (-) Transcript_14359:173-988(-)